MRQRTRNLRLLVYVQTENTPFPRKVLRSPHSRTRLFNPKPVRDTDRLLLRVVLSSVVSAVRPCPNEVIYRRLVSVPAVIVPRCGYSLVSSTVSARLVCIALGEYWKQSLLLDPSRWSTEQQGFLSLLLPAWLSTNAVRLMLAEPSSDLTRQLPWTTYSSAKPPQHTLLR